MIHEKMGLSGIRNSLMTFSDLNVHYFQNGCQFGKYACFIDLLYLKVAYLTEEFHAK